MLLSRILACSAQSLCLSQHISSMQVCQVHDRSVGQQIAGGQFSLANLIWHSWSALALIKVAWGAYPRQIIAQIRLEASRKAGRCDVKVQTAEEKLAVLSVKRERERAGKRTKEGGKAKKIYGRGQGRSVGRNTRTQMGRIKQVRGTRQSIFVRPLLCTSSLFVHGQRSP